MEQIGLAVTGFESTAKKARKRVFLDKVNLVVQWTELVSSRHGGGLADLPKSASLPCTY